MINQQDIMKKKEYISPAIQVFEMNTPCILVGSGEETGGGSTGSGITQEEWDSMGPGFGSNDPKYPGQGL